MMNKGDDYPELNTAFRHLRDQLSETSTPVNVEQNIMRAFVKKQQSSNMRHASHRVYG